jgi:hypothetical protein
MLLRPESNPDGYRHPGVTSRHRCLGSDPSPALTTVADGAAIASRRTTPCGGNLSPVRGAIMTVTSDPTTLPAVADRADTVANDCAAWQPATVHRQPGIWSTSPPSWPRSP